MSNPTELRDRLEALRAALKQISETRFGWDGDCGVTSIADEALSADDEAARSQMAGVECAITAKPSPEKPIFTEEDHNMLHAVAAYMRRSESPRCSNDLINLAERLRDAQKDTPQQNPSN